MVADLQIEAEEANGGVLLTVVDSARLTMLLTRETAAELLDGPQPAERAADADGSDGSETSVSGLHAAEQVREARACVSGVEKRLKAVQRLFVQDVLGWVQPTLRWAELSDLVLCLLGQCTNRVYHARYD